MKNLSGNRLTEFPFQDVFKVGDLVNYNGPLLSLFSNEKGELFLFHWCDNDENYNRWFIFKVTLTQLYQYLNRRVSHYKLITTYFNDYIISVDVDNDLNYNNILLLNGYEIPDEYLPEKDVLHKDDESLHLEKIKNYLIHLEDKATEIRRSKWQQKFKTSISYETLLSTSIRIFNREQILAVQ